MEVGKLGLSLLLYFSALYYVYNKKIRKKNIKVTEKMGYM